MARPLVRAGLLFAALAVLTALGAFVVARFRGGKGDGQPTTSELLTKFRELHEQGELSGEEFRNIKANLAERLEAELKGNAQQG